MRINSRLSLSVSLGLLLTGRAASGFPDQAGAKESAPTPNNDQEFEPPPAPLKTDLPPSSTVPIGAQPNVPVGTQSAVPVGTQSTQGEMALFALDDTVRELVFSSVKVEQTIREAPSIASTVTRQQIELYGWLSPIDVLYRQPGFSPSQDFEKRTVTARGFYEGWNNNHILMLFDGLPYNENFYGSAYTMEVTPLFLFKNIEILRGPSSALYGTNAVQGTVALNSLSASDLPAPAIGLVRIGQQNTQTYDVVAGKESSYASFVVGYNHHRTDGNSYLDYDLSGRVDAGGNRQQFLVKDARSSHFGFLKIEGKGALEGLSLQTHLLFFNNQTGHGWLWYISDDDSEYVQEDRQLISLRYTKKVLNGKLTPDVVVRYQRRGLDLHTKLYPNNTVIGSGGTATIFPDGLIENIQTSFHDIFLRAQISWNIRPGMSLTAGAENTIFLYRGDNLHESNVDLSTTFQPWNPPGIRPLGPYLEWLGNNPLNNTGIFLQYFSGRILRNYVSVTAGLRLDAQTFVYNDLTQADRPSVRGTHFAASPRLAILLFPHERLTIKLLGNRAFRAPSPAELFGANTYLLGSNPKVLQPEIISTGELGIDTTVIPYFTVRANIFYQFVENLIGYAPSTNALLNLYTRGVIGVETEALARGTWGKNNELQGFANYSYAHTVLETVPEDSGLTAHSGRLTWAPAHVVNLGIGYTGHGFGFSMQMHYQGAMQRRDSDMATAANAAMRPASVDGWVSFDARASYSPLPWLQLGVQANNLFNQTGYLIKPNDFPFDYRTDGLRVLGTLQIHAGPFS